MGHASRHRGTKCLNLTKTSHVIHSFTHQLKTKTLIGFSRCIKLHIAWPRYINLSCTSFDTNIVDVSSIRNAYCQLKILKYYYYHLWGHFHACMLPPSSCFLNLIELWRETLSFTVESKTKWEISIKISIQFAANLDIIFECAPLFLAKLHS